MCSTSPEAIAKAETQPVRLPPEIALDNTYKMSGPGAAIAAEAATKNKMNVCHSGIFVRESLYPEGESGPVFVNEPQRAELTERKIS